MKNNLGMILGVGVVVLLAGAGFAYWKWGMGPKTEAKPVTGYKTQPVNGKVKITVWSWGKPALKDIVPDFNKVYPDIEVNVETYPHNEVEQKLDFGITSGGTMPDVIAMEGTIAPQYIERGALLDITDKASRYVKGISAYKWPEVTKNGRIYGIPWDNGPVAMFYRRDLLAAVGIEPESIKTWEDFIAAGKKVSKGGQHMIAISKRNEAVDFFEMLLQQQGGSFFDEKNNVTINTPAGINALKLMKRMVDEGIAADIGYWSPEFYDSLRKGKVATYVQAAWLSSFLKDIAPNTEGKWGVSPMPGFTAGGVRSSNNGGSNLGVYAKSPNTDAAWKYVEFALTRTSSQVKMYQTTDLFPSLESVYQDPSFSVDPDKFYAGQNINTLFVDVQKQIPANWHYGPYYREATKILDKELISFLNGNKTAEKALGDATDKIKGLVK